MSGYKRATVMINQDEFDRLREAEQKLRSVPQIDPQLIQELSRQSTQALEKNLTQVRSRQGRFEKMVSALDESVQTLERSTNQAMVAFEENLVRQTEQYTGQLWSHVDKVLAQHTAQFEETIAVNHRIYQEDLYQQARQIRRMEDDVQRKADMAAAWLEAASSFCAFIKDNYPHQEFAPGQVDWLERQLNQARQNLGIGLSEAVIVSAQQIYTAFSDLRIEIERKFSEWRLLYQSVWETAVLLLNQVEASAELPAIDLDGNELPVKLDVNFWSQGKLEGLYQTLSTVCQELEDPASFLELDHLEKMLCVDLPGYDQQLCDLVLDARIAVLNSQLRINIADLVIKALQDQGFNLEESDYEAADMRQAFNAHLSNLEGNEVFVYVNPSGSEIGENDLHVESLDRDQRTEHELEQRWFEVDRSLAAFGLDVSGYERLDVPSRNAVRERGAGQRPRAPQRKRNSSTHSAGLMYGN